MTMDQNLIPSSDYQGVKPTGEIFVVDDDRDVRNMLAACLAPEGFPVTTFEDGDFFMTAARTRVPICVFLDVVLPKRSGLEILKELREQRFSTPTFLLSARDDIPTVVEAIKNGAHDFIKSRSRSMRWRSGSEMQSMRGCVVSATGALWILTRMRIANGFV